MQSWFCMSPCRGLLSGPTTLRTIEAFDPNQRVDFTRRVATIPGAEALTVAQVPEPMRERTVMESEVEAGKGKRLVEVLRKIGSAGR